MGYDKQLANLTEFHEHTGMYKKYLGNHLENNNKFYPGQSFDKSVTIKYENKLPMNGK